MHDHKTTRTPQSSALRNANSSANAEPFGCLKDAFASNAKAIRTGGLRWILALAFAILLPSLVAANGNEKEASINPRGVFAGTIGGHSVVAELGISPNLYPPTDGVKALGGQYFYRKYGLGIALLVVRNNDGSLTMREMVHAYPVPKPSGDVWRVRLFGDHLRGTWEARDNRTATTVDLVRIGDAAGKPGENARLYDAELSREPATRGAERIVGPNLGYVTLTDLRFAISGVEITRLDNETARTTANATLAEKFNSYRIQASECRTHGLYFIGDEFVQDARVAMFSSSALSLDERVRFDCGGVHPGESFDPLTIDLRDGSAVDWKKAIADRGAIAKLYVVRAPLVFRDDYYSRECPPVYKSTGSAHIKDDLEYEIVPAGLLVRVDFPHVVARCEADVVLSSTEVRAFFAPRYRVLLP